MTTATAQAFANIAFIKYWGNRDNTLRIPMNGSTSMNLDGLYTRTVVSFQPSLPFDELIINGRSYGLLTQADAVTVDHGKVLINQTVVPAGARR